MWFRSFLVLFSKEPKAVHISMLSSHILKTQVRERLNVPVPQSTKVQKLGNLTRESHSKRTCRKLGWKEYRSKNKQNFKKKKLSLPLSRHANSCLHL